MSRHREVVPSKSILRSAKMRRLPPPSLSPILESPRRHPPPRQSYAASTNATTSDFHIPKTYETGINHVVAKYLGDAYRAGYGMSAASDVYRNCPCCAERNLLTVKKRLPSDTWHLDQNPYYYSPREYDGADDKPSKADDKPSLKLPPIESNQYPSKSTKVLDLIPKQHIPYYRPESSTLHDQRYEELRFNPDKYKYSLEYDPRFIYLTQPSMLELYKHSGSNGDWGDRYNHTLAESIVEASTRYYQSMDKLAKTIHHMD